MYYSKFKGLFITKAVICLCMSFAGYAQEYQLIELEPDSTYIQIAQDTKNKEVLLIHTNISELFAKELDTKGGTFISLESSELMKVFGEGKPNVPVFSKLVEVPLDAEFDFEVISFDEEIVNLRDHGIDKKIVPAQPSQSKTEEVPFYYDSAAYNTDRFEDAEFVVIEDLGIMRSVRLIRVQIHPIRYNPVQNSLKIYNDLRIELKQKSADYPGTAILRERYSSELFNRMLERVVLNLEFGFKPVSDMITYVIISDRMFETTLQSFILWKQQLGYHVIARYTDEADVGSSTTTIKNYLENLYNNPPQGTNPPQYVLFVGDVAQIPAYDCTTGNHISDLYYCEYTGDALPEVFYGRFSATTVAQLQPQIDKTLMYEIYNMPDPSYLFNDVLVAGADAAHATTYGNGQINYASDEYWNSTNGFTSNMYLQPEPAGGNYSSDIRSNISNGVGFANYTAHCDPTGWSNPSFSVDHISGLTNNDMYGLWVGNCCRSNRFNVNECFGEAALRTEDKGAVGYIGATDYTYWDEDFWWAVGFKNVSSNPVYNANHLGGFDRLFHIHSEPVSDWYSTQGQLIYGGNLAVLESTSSMKTYYWEVYQLMGDPSLEIRITEPHSMDVIHAPTAPRNNSRFVVAVKKGGTSIMLENATVTLLKDDEVVDSKKTAIAYPDRGTAKFSYSLSEGPMTICVSKSNYIPYIGTCDIKNYLQELWVSLHGGVTLPYEDWYEDAGCFNYIINLEYRFRFRWAVVIDVAYNNFMWRDPRERFPWWNISPTIRHYIPLHKLRPFVNIGPGYYIPDQGTNRFGFKIGLGLDYSLFDRLNLEIGSDFHNIFKAEEQTLYQNEATSFQHFHAGIIYRLASFK